MLNEQSRANLGDALRRSVRTSLMREATDLCQIDATAPGCVTEPLGSKLVLITISSFVFRLLTVFQLSDDSATRDYYLRGASDTTLEYAFQEFANMCCGSLNRELSTHCFHLAVSTPHQLESRCLSFLDHLRPQYRSNCDITINQAVRLRISLCMFCDKAVDITSVCAPVDHGTGVLELF